MYSTYTWTAVFSLKIKTKQPDQTTKSLYSLCHYAPAKGTWKSWACLQIVVKDYLFIYSFILIKYITSKEEAGKWRTFSWTKINSSLYEIYEEFGKYEYHVGE